MLDARQQARFARGVTLAAMDYTAATHQAAFETTRQMLSFWSTAFGAAAPEPEPRSWYRHPDAPHDHAPRGHFAAGIQLSFPFPAGSMAGWPFAPMPMANPLAAWQAIGQAMATAPWTLSPAAWPSAFMMMAGGVPKSVAWPAAEANAALADAASAVSEAVDRSYSQYRSDGGHAVAQIIMLPLKAGLAVLAAAPFAGALPHMPWQAVFAPYP